MTILYPPMETINRGYAAWLGASVPASSAEEEVVDQMETESGFQAFGDGPLPDLVYDAVLRQIAARPVHRAPRSGDLVVLPAPVADDFGEPQWPAVVVLDERVGENWSGWLVGAHTDYAGDRDLVLEASLIEGGSDPAPIAGMVLCWDGVSLQLSKEVEVIHRLTDSALEVIRILASGTSVGDQAAGPGHMMQRELAGQVVVTGAPYTQNDPRADYLRLARSLARRLSDPEFDHAGRLSEPRREGPQR